MNTMPATNANANASFDKTHSAGTGRKHLESVLGLCIQKTRRNIEDLANEPRSWSWDVTGDYAKWDENFFAISNWTSSFITGMALLAWQLTEDEHFFKQTLRLQKMYEDKVFRHHEDTMHDLGFLYSLYSIGLYKLSGSKAHRDVGLRAADLLAARYNAKAKFIRAWGRMDAEGVGTADDGMIPVADMAIIDCMMNLPLLFWAANETGHKKFYDIAVCHADTTLKNFLRADDSIYHAFRFDLQTGEPARGENYCGHSVESHWARGTAWAVYGFALCHRYTREAKYREVALRLVKKFIANLDSEMVPVWDFRLPAGELRLRDSSAAAIVICGIQELLKHEKNMLLSQTKDDLLLRLCSTDYVDFDLRKRGILKDGQVGRAKNAYTSWGDYYLMEALAVELHGTPTVW